MSYAQIEKRVNLSMEHFKKPCLNGDCEQDGDRVIHCERHADTSAIVRRYIRMEEFKEAVQSDCFSPEWCGLACNEYCDNCREDLEYSLNCKMDVFNR